MRQPLPLARFRAVETRNIEEAEDLFARMTTRARFEPVGREVGFGWTANAVAIGTVHLSAHEYGAAFRGETEVVDGIFTTSFPLDAVPALGVDAGSRIPTVRGKQTWICSPGRAAGFQVERGYRALQITIQQSDAEAALGALLGAPVKTPLRFTPTLSLEHGVGAHLERLVGWLTTELEADAAHLASPIVGARFADALLGALLLGQPHNHSAALGRERDAEPPFVRRAAEFLDAHAREPVRMADLARAAGVSVRALQLGFRKTRGCSPMEFLRERRLQLARQSVLEGGATITEAAFDCGFSHMSRFAAQYRARFGESPSETRARARAKRR